MGRVRVFQERRPLRDGEGGGHNPATLSVHLGQPISRGRDLEKASNWEAFFNAIQSHDGVPAHMKSMMAHSALEPLTPEERAEHGEALKADALALHPGNVLLSEVLERNAAQSVEDRKKERWRKRHAGELLRQQGGRP